MNIFDLKHFSFFSHIDEYQIDNSQTYNTGFL